MNIDDMFLDGQFNSRKLRTISEERKAEIFAAGIVKTENIVEAIYWIHNNLKDYPKKCYCGKPVTKFISFNQGYRSDFCSTKCLNNSPEVQAKKRQSSKAKYGTDYPWQSKDIKNKIRDSYLTNLWNSDRFSQFSEYVLKTSKDEFNSCHTSKLLWECKQCNLEFETFASNGIISPECPACFHHDTSSKAHREILDFIKTEYSGKIIVNDRRTIRPLELDIHLVDLKLAIEFDGLYWHSYDRMETSEEKRKHLTKTELCCSQGIKLIHIFENEWKNKKEIVKSRLKAAVGSSPKVFARKCTIDRVSGNEANEFQDTHHIQGRCVSSVKLGLRHNGILVALMTFSKPRFNKQYEWELIRYCSSGNVVGGASKLLKHFERTYSPSSIISYADRRWSDGNLYRQLDFVERGASAPNYWYYKNNSILEHRLKFQKFKLKTLLTDFDDALSESENMFRAGYRRIWDCGNYVFVKTY